MQTSSAESSQDNAAGPDRPVYRRHAGAGRKHRLIVTLCTGGLVTCAALIPAWLWFTYQARQSASLPVYKIDINTAPAQEIALLPGWGLSLGEALVRSREQSGRFETKDRLLRVPGVSVRLLNRARPYIRVGDTAASDR